MFHASATRVAVESTDEGEVLRDRGLKEIINERTRTTLAALIRYKNGMNKRRKIKVVLAGNETWKRIFTAL